MDLFEILVKSLNEKNYYITVAESCTGGLFASNIVKVSGASNVFALSFVTYSNEAKINQLNVNKTSIDIYGVVSEQVAIEMAFGATKKAGADIGIGITGYAGPNADNDYDVGKVCFGFVDINDNKSFSKTINFGNIGRENVRSKAVEFAAKTIIDILSC